MNVEAERVLSFLDALGIRYRISEHAPTATMAACAEIDGELHALTPKNIFLTTKNGRRFYLCLTRPEARFRTADISRQAGSSRLSFAPEDRLYDLLKCHPGAASPLGLIFDRDHAVSLLIDSALLDTPSLAFHPCDNTLTLAMSGADFFDQYLPAVEAVPVYVEIHDFIQPF